MKHSKRITYTNAEFVAAVNYIKEKPLERFRLISKSDKVYYNYKYYFPVFKTADKEGNLSFRLLGEETGFLAPKKDGDEDLTETGDYKISLDATRQYFDLKTKQQVNLGQALIDLSDVFKQYSKAKYPKYEVRTIVQTEYFDKKADKDVAMEKPKAWVLIPKVKSNSPFWEEKGMQAGDIMVRVFNQKSRVDKKYRSEVKKKFGEKAGEYYYKTYKRVCNDRGQLHGKELAKKYNPGSLLTASIAVENVMINAKKKLIIFKLKIVGDMVVGFKPKMNRTVVDESEAEFLNMQAANMSLNEDLDDSDDSGAPVVEANDDEFNSEGE